MISTLMRLWPRPVALLAILAMGLLLACGNGNLESTPGTDPQKEEQAKSTPGVATVAAPKPTITPAPTAEAITPAQVPEVATEVVLAPTPAVITETVLETTPTTTTEATSEPTSTKNYCDGQTSWREEMTSKEFAARVSETRSKYLDTLMAKPNVVGVGEGYFKDDEGNLLDTVGLIVIIDHRHEVVDQSTLPEADRIPDCLDGIPVQIELEEVIEDLD